MSSWFRDEEKPLLKKEMEKKIRKERDLRKEEAIVDSEIRETKQKIKITKGK